MSSEPKDENDEVCPEETMDGCDLLSEFRHFCTDFEDADDVVDQEWVEEFFGRGRNRPTRVGLSHLDEKFVQSCSGGQHCFDKFKIDSGEVLKTVSDRYICTGCYRSRRFFCYQCLGVSPELCSGQLPLVSLPVRITVLKHCKEVDGKATSPHAAILAPDHVEIYTYPQLPEDWPEDPTKVLLVFPRKDALSLAEYLAKHLTTTTTTTTAIAHSSASDPGDLCAKPHLSRMTSPHGPAVPQLPFQRVVFIDSTWRQTNSIINDVRLKHLPAIILDNEETLFWRYHRRRPLHYLSTIEAIYYFCRQLHQHLTTYNPQAYPPYNGQYDNLLFFFKYTYQLIKDRYHL